MRHWLPGYSISGRLPSRSIETIFIGRGHSHKIMTIMDTEETMQLDFDKMGGLVPAIVQD